jgi:cyclopropane-fatty-acyl-phospholipid synthase
MGYGPGEPKVSILFHKPLPVDFSSGNLVVAFGEAYMEGLVDFEGSMEEIIRIVEKNKENIAGGITGKFVSAINSMASSRSRQKQNIQHHYDLGNDFFALWLDETMSYSCAYFKSPDDSLYQAQLQKIHHTLKKLQLKPGERLLDIGCGWGWLIIKAALNYRVRAMGITLSEEQYRAVKDKIMEYNLGHLVEVKLANYLDLAEEDYRFEKIVSVGMFEHVGRENLGKYMEAVGTMLSPGGLSLLHSIMGTDEHPPNQWIDKYIFPGGYIPSLRETLGLFPEYNFHLLHAESLRLHYALTLDRWYDNFKKHIPAVREKFDEKFIRMWGLYLASCAASFRVSGLDIYQLLFSKGLNNELPLTLDYIYE